MSLRVFAGCAANTPTGPGAPLDMQIVLAPGESSDIAGTVRVQFQSVVNDSRCPGDALCISPGDAVVRVSVRPTTDGTAATLDLSLHNAEPSRVGDVSIALEQLNPYPFASRGPIPAGDYRATLRVTR